MCIENNFELKLFNESNDLNDLNDLNYSTKLEDQYSDIYEGEYNDKNINDISNKSKLIIYLQNDYNLKKKIDRIIIKIMCSSGILMIPYNKKIDHILKDEYNCLIFDGDYLKKIFDVLTKYNKYQMIGKNANKYVTNFSINTWVGNIINLINNK